MKTDTVPEYFVQYVGVEIQDIIPGNTWNVATGYSCVGNQKTRNNYF